MTSVIPIRWPPGLKYLSRPEFSPSVDVSTRLKICPNGGHFSTTRHNNTTIKLIPPGSSHPAQGQFGLFARKPLKSGTLILDYIGIYHLGTVSDDTSDYDIALRWGDLYLAIDASKSGNEARMVNDYRGVKGSPNAKFDVYVNSAGEVRMGVFVMGRVKDGKAGIGKGEEILVSFSIHCLCAPDRFLRGSRDIECVAHENQPDKFADTATTNEDIDYDISICRLLAMDKFVTISKPTSTSKKRPREETEHERIMRFATTVRGGHDTWQSASTGHQVSDSGAKSVHYRAAREHKLRVQFPSIPSRHIGTSTHPDTQTAPPSNSTNYEGDRQGRDSDSIELFNYVPDENQWYATNPTSLPPLPQRPAGGVFDGCVIYLDGYISSKTQSDHSLRRLITLNGGLLSISPSRTKTTHLVLSKEGALAHGKVKKEIQRRKIGGGGGWKVVTVEWVMECIKVKRRVPEWNFRVPQVLGSDRCAATFFTPGCDEGVEKKEGEAVIA